MNRIRNSALIFNFVSLFVAALLGVVCFSHPACGQASERPRADKRMTQKRAPQKRATPKKRAKENPQRAVSLGEVPEQWQELITNLVIENVPNKYEDKKKWGKKKEVTRGLSIRREGFRIKTNRKKKEVNHGTWTMYRITQVEPEENIRVQISRIRDIGDGQLSFEIRLTSKLHAFARMSRWNRGVQLISLSTDADALVQVRLQGEMSMKMDGLKLPPDMILKPEVTSADLVLHEFKVQRISKVNGPIAAELGRSLRKVLEKKIEEKRAKLPEKINRQIAKNEDKLRISVHDIVSEKWKEMTDGFELPSFESLAKSVSETKSLDKEVAVDEDATQVATLESTDEKKTALSLAAPKSLDGTPSETPLISQGTDHLLEPVSAGPLLLEPAVESSSDGPDLFAPQGE